MAVIKDRYQLEIETSGATAGLTRLKGALPIAAFAAAGAAALAFSKQMLDSQKVIEGYRNQLRLITDGQADLEETFGTLAQSARKTRTELGSTIELFQKLTIATEEMRVSEEDVLTVTEQLSKALAVAGADAATTSSVVRQFGQAMASGTVRGDEFNSLVEGLGPALAIMARESGITVGELRNMSQAGELTASVMFDMLKNSNSLNESFAKLAPTTEQLTTQLGESWTYATAQLGEYLRVQEAANNGLLFLTRQLDSLSENPAAPLVNKDTQEILQGVKDGLIDSEIALRELSDRAQLAATNGARIREAFDFSNTNEDFEDISAALIELEAYLSAIEVAAQRDAGAFGDVAQAMSETGREIQKINKEQEVFAQGFGLAGEKAQEFTKFLEELNNKVTENIAKDEQIAKAIEHFNFMLEQGIISIERHAEAMKLLGNSAEQTKTGFEELGSIIEEYNAKFIDNLDSQERARIQYDQVRENINALNEELKNNTNLTQEQTTEIQNAITALEAEKNALHDVAKSGEFLNNIIRGSQDALAQNRQEHEQLTGAIAQLEMQMKSEVFATEETEVALLSLREALKLNNEEYDDMIGKVSSTTNEYKRLQDAIDGINQSTQDRIQQARNTAELDGLRGIQRELREIEIREKRTAEAAKRRLRQQAENAGISVNAADLAAIDNATRNSIEIQQELAQQTYDNQRSFATGWKNAFEEYEEAATDSAKLAGDIFNRFSKGMEDSIVDFAKTGKFEMKDFLADIAEMILRAGIQKLIARAFGLGGGSGGMPFAGGFANGGTIPSGQFGLVGENGPELISGPANITPITAGGSTTVNYNINAVDAPSFQNLVARDPKFIFAVTEKGRQSVPQTRR